MLLVDRCLEPAACAVCSFGLHLNKSDVTRGRRTFERSACAVIVYIVVVVSSSFHSSSFGLLKEPFEMTRLFNHHSFVSLPRAPDCVALANKEVFDKYEGGCLN